MYAQVPKSHAKMKRIAAQFLAHHTKPPTTTLLHSLSTSTTFLLSTPYSSSSSNVAETSTTTLTDRRHHHHHHNLTPEEVKQINLLLPRLCESNHLHEAIRLIDTVLLTNPPLNSLSLPVLIDRLSQEPSMTHSMSLLNRLKHSPASLLHISKLLLVSYFKKRKFKEVMKVMMWIWRSDLPPCHADTVLYRIVVKGLCRNNKTVEALMVVKKMVESGVAVGSGVRDLVCRSLLWEARIKEAKELNECLKSCDLVEDDDHLCKKKRVVGLLDRMISNWTD